MKREITSDKDFIEAFNHGYELSKELGLKPDVLKDLSAGNNRMQAMKEGMEQYQKEVELEKGKDIIPPFDIDSIDNSYVDLSLDNDDKEKGKDLDL
jgi:hypothetical protein